VFSDATELLTENRYEYPLGTDLIQCIYRDSKHVLETCSDYAGKSSSRSASQMLEQISPVNWHVAVIGI